MVRRIRISVCRRSASLIYLANEGEANGKTDTPPLCFGSQAQCSRFTWLDTAKLGCACAARMLSITRHSYETEKRPPQGDGIATSSQTKAGVLAHEPHQWSGQA